MNQDASQWLRGQIVNRSRCSTGCLSLGMLLVLLGATAGCATSGLRKAAEPSVIGGAGPAYPIAIHYDLESVPAEPMDEHALARIRENFRMLSGLGFEHVALGNLAGAERRILHAAARDAGLGLIESTNTTGDLLRGVQQRRSEQGDTQADQDFPTPQARPVRDSDFDAALPPDQHRIASRNHSIESFDRHAPAGNCVTVSHRPTIWDRGRPVGSGPAIRGPITSHRAPLLRAVPDGRMATRLARASDPIRMASARGASNGRGPAIVDSSALLVPKGQSPLEHLMHRYHTALSLGYTNGLIVVSGRGAPFAESGLLDRPEPLTPAQRTAIEALIGRAGHWGGRIAGLSVQRVALVGRRPESVTATLLRGQDVRYLLIHNTSLERYARGQVRLSARIHGTVDRAVEVRTPFGRSPQTPVDQVPGRVLTVQQGELVLPIDLRPGDAALFELF